MNTITGLYSTATGLAQLRQGFAKADANTNKTLSFAEFEAAAKLNPNITASASTEATFAKLDTDGNKQLTANEVTQGLNLTTQVYSALLQGQEIRSGNAFLTLLGSTSNASSVFGTDASSNYFNLTSSLMGGGSASTYLTSLTSGANPNTTLLAAMFDGSGSTASRLESLLSQYVTTDTQA